MTFKQAYLLLCTESWAQRINMGCCQQCMKAAALWPEVDREVLQPEEHTTSQLKS